jgi:hypothetical protein
LKITTPTEKEFSDPSLQKEGEKYSKIINLIFFPILQVPPFKGRDLGWGLSRTINSFRVEKDNHPH